MRITFISVGQVKKAHLKDGVEEYIKRIKRYFPVDVIEVKDESVSLKMPREDVLKKEGERILKKLPPGNFIVALGEKGKEYSSRGFASFVNGLLTGGKKGITFIVGGAYGLHEDVYGAAGLVMSLSRMTLAHDMARLMISEQVYRAFTIIRGEPYSH